MKNKGFTLVELLVVIVILGIVTGMSWPTIRRIQENNTISKYEKYGESLESAAKIYVDSYEEDLFYYEDDLSTTSQNNGQCAFITYAELKEHGLANDYEQNGMTCNSPNTFVIVKRRKGKYQYKYYLGCGNETDILKTEPNNLPTSKVYYVFPANDTNIPYEVGPSGKPYAEFGCSPATLK